MSCAAEPGVPLVPPHLGLLPPLKQASSQAAAWSGICVILQEVQCFKTTVVVVLSFV